MKNAVLLHEYRIVFTYDPSSFTEGWVLSLAAALVLLLAVAVSLFLRLRSVSARHARGTHARRATPGGSR